MTEQDKVTLIETEQRAKSNTHRIEKLEDDVHEIQNDQKAIYKIATSVEVIAQRVTTIEDKVEDTNLQVGKLSEKVSESESRPYRQVATNWNSIKIAIITGICTMIATGTIGAIISFSVK